MTITVPALSLVVLVGATSSGKSSFARRHFLATETVSSDACRAMVADDENVMDANADAFALLHTIVATRLRRGLLTVVDATNLQAEARRPLLALAREHDCLAVAVVFKVDERVLMERNAARPERHLPPHVVRNHASQLRRSLRLLEREGFRHVAVLDGVEAVEAAAVERRPLWNDRRDDHGPFDVIGDVHGCAEELRALLELLGYAEVGGAYRHPEGRRAVFCGDLVDRGPDTPAVLRTVMAMHAAETALCVPGNHDVKLMRALRGRRVQVTHGLAQSLEQLGREPAEVRTAAADWIDSLVSHYVLDGGRLVVAHAGLKEAFHGRASGRVRQFALYGETTGETDEFGLPVRYDWASDYRGRAAVVYGHTPVAETEWVNGTICVDTGCVFGGRLTALRWPERELAAIPALRTWYEPAKPFLAAAAPTAPRPDRLDLLDIRDVTGRRSVTTALAGNVTVGEAHAAAALEAMSRFAVDPRWLVHLPPTMSPTETSRLDGHLEHPAEAFAYYRGQGVAGVVCEEKHMGSRAVVVVCRDEETAARRFHIEGDGAGVCCTRTGRRFFDDRTLEDALLDRLRRAAADAGLWDELETDWLCLDAEIMPWSAKAGELLRSQYAPVAASARASLRAAEEAVELTAARGIEVDGLLDRLRGHARAVEAYARAYGAYCWDTRGVDDLRVAVFCVLAGDREVYAQRRDHLWHMDVGARLAAVGGPVLTATEHRTVDVTAPDSVDAATAWWAERTAAGAEGMVVKPVQPVVRGPRGLVQPAVKCRGREYLRIIYGPEYDRSDNLAILRSRSLHLKRSLARREFALGIEALERFVRGEPLHRVHECVFAVLALESEPVDPRL